MKALQVDVPGGHYPILIGSGVLGRVAGWIRRQAKPSSLYVVTDETVLRRHGRVVLAALDSAGVPVTTTVVRAGERSKSARVLERLWREAVRTGTDRRSCVVAVGGGVVGDLAGFVAGTVLRGVRFVQLPTTLLAMVDSSVGGKTGINLPEGKNLVGVFHQPEAVFIDTAFLRTLPRREYCAGWAEIIKAAAIRDARLFARLERDGADLSQPGAPGLEPVIRAAVRIKAEVVNADERESGLRMVLNFGHTLAHGLEAAVRYGGLLHGEAVAIGMVFASRLGVALGRVEPEVPGRLAGLLERYGLPVRLARRHGVEPRRVLAAMGRDKKKGPAGQRWVLVPRIGRSTFLDGVPEQTVRVAVTQFLLNGGRAQEPDSRRQERKPERKPS